MSETPLYIPTEAGALFAVLHVPAAPGAPRAAVLLLAPGLDEKRAAHGPLARIARALEAAGCAALRFDCRGTGDSAGESVEVSLGSMERDAAAVAAFLREKAAGAPLVLVGVRLGASLALRLSGALGASKVVAMAPIVSGAAWLRQERGRNALRRSMIARELAAAAAAGPSGAGGEAPGPALPPGIAEDLGGLPLSGAFIEELQSLDLLAEPVSGAGESTSGGPDVLVVQVSPRKSPLPEIEKLAALRGARVDCLSTEPFWQPLEHPEVDRLAEAVKGFVGAAGAEGGGGEAT